LLVFLLAALGAQLFLTKPVSAVALVLAGTRTAVFLGALTAITALPLGLLAGTIAGWSGRRADALLARAVEVTSTLPVLIVAGVVMTWSPASTLLHLGVCLGLLRGVELARVIRGEVLRLSQHDFVLAARALGASPSRTLLRHVLPHCLRPIAVNVALTAAYAIGVEAMASFVGLREPSGWVSWGSVLSPALPSPPGAAPMAAAASVALTWVLCALGESSVESADPLRPDLRLAARRG
jgi:ABC-type dipeptide/oligopeptide/nickel transport system permease subunit